MFWVNKAYAGNTFMPPQASNFAESVDTLYGFLYYSSLISCILVIGGLIYFAFKYKRKTDSDKTAYIPHNAVLEFLWSFIPFVIFIAVFAWGWKIFYDMRKAPKDALEIHVVGQKWNWEFIYKSGRKVTGDFAVPIDTPVKLIMSSRDVLHSFFVPSFRVKQDVVPGRYTSLWFTATKKGDFHVFCTEYCGDSHSEMLAKVKVMSKADYELWLDSDLESELSLAQRGQKHYATKCAVCHNTTAVKKIGPGFKGLFGAERQLTDGTTIVADEAYIKESILNPNAKMSVGYENGGMQSFQGQLTEDDVTNIIEYLKTLK